MRRTIPKPLLTALVLPLVVIVGFQSAWAAYACRIDGKVRDHCCCKTEKKTQRTPVDDGPRITRPDCCDVTINEATEAPRMREAARATFEHVPVVVPAVMPAIVAPRVEHVTAVATMARPPPRVPVFLDKHAILR